MSMLNGGGDGASNERYLKIWEAYFKKEGKTKKKLRFLGKKRKRKRKRKKGECKKCQVRRRKPTSRRPR